MPDTTTSPVLLHNTLTGHKAPLETLEPGKCGI